MSGGKSKPVRRRKAVIVTGALAAVLMLPIAGLKLLGSARAAGTGELGQVPEFLLKDVDGAHVSRFDLEGGLTIAATIGDVCADAASARCAEVLERLSEIAGYVDERLLYQNGTEKSPLRLYLVAGGAVAAPAPWRRIETTAADEAGVFLAAGQAVPSLSVVDQGGGIVFAQAIAAEPLLPVLQPLLSRLTINHYMRDYLAKRTFFRRTPKPAAEASGS